MTVSRRLFLVSAAALPLTGGRIAAAQTGEGPVATIRRFYDTLLGAMKRGKQLSFDQRYQMLASAAD